MRILLVEDDVSTKKTIELMLEDLGHAYDSVELGEDGIDLAMRRSYDLILLDIMLPGMDGYDVIQRLRANQVDTPVLLQSALLDRDLAVEGLSFGVQDYLIKPYSQAELAARIDSSLNRTGPGAMAEGAEPPAPVPAHEERRVSRRRDLVKTAQIRGGESDSAMDCLILNLSDEGAALKPASPPDCPPTFRLEVSSDLTRPCEVCWRYRNKVGVRFLEA